LGIIKAICRWLGAWGVVFAIGWLLAAHPANANAQTTQPLPPSVTLETDKAQPNFPDAINFHFKGQAGSDAPVFKWIELGYKLEGEVETTIRHQPLEPGAGLAADISVDTHKDYIPPGTRISYYWLLGTNQGDIYETSTQQFTYQDNRYPFKELTNGLFTVRWFQGEAAFGQAAMNKVTATVDRLSRLYKVKPDRQINLTIYPDTRTMFTALPPNTQEWVGGQAIPELGTIVLAISPGDSTEIGRSIPHEISHQVIYQATRNPYNVTPKWLDEGLAVNNQDQIDGFLVEAFERARDQRTLFPLRVLNGSFPADSQLSFVAYGQSVQVVRYILQKYGDGGMEKILASFKQGVSYDEAIQIGLGISLDQLDREWKQSIGYPVPDLPPATVTATPGPAISTNTPPGLTLSPTLTPQAEPTLTLAPASTPTAPATARTPVVTGTPPAQALVPVVTVTTAGTASSSLPPSTPAARNSGDNDNLLVGALAGTGLALLAALVVLVTIAVRKRP
jgi:hypothetical protein